MPYGYLILGFDIFKSAFYLISLDGCTCLRAFEVNSFLGLMITDSLCSRLSSSVPYLPRVESGIEGEIDISLENSNPYNFAYLFYDCIDID